MSFSNKPSSHEGLVQKKKKNPDNSEHYKLSKEGTTSLLILREATLKTNNEEIKYGPT